MTNQIIPVPDIAIVKKSGDTKRLLSLREQKIRKNDALREFAPGSGVKYNSDLYILGDTTTEIVRATTAKKDLSFSIHIADAVTVDWGDGTTTVASADPGIQPIAHTYTDTVPHTIKIHGTTSALIQFSCPDQNITTLDITRNTALKTLYCVNNQITALDVTRNTVLTELYCYRNTITTLDVSHNIALRKLYCDTNQMTTLHLGRNTALIYLHCLNNALTTLDVSQNTALTTISCDNNQITALDVTRNTALTELYCGGNALTTLDVSQNTTLTTISCDDNQITALDVTRNTALTELYCGGNALTTLDVSQNTTLIILSIRNTPLINNISAITATVSTLPIRTGQTAGRLILNNTAAATAIQSICDSKNWQIS